MNQNIYHRNQNAVQPEFRSCFKCRFEGNIESKVCPRCGRRLFTATNVRWRGFFLVLIGLFLAGFMGAIAVFVTMFLTQAAQKPGNSVKFNQDSHLFLMVYIIFGSVIAMGFTATVMGIWMLIFGKRNRFLLWIFFALMFLAFFVGSIFRGMAN